MFMTAFISSCPSTIPSETTPPHSSFMRERRSETFSGTSSPHQQKNTAHAVFKNKKVQYGKKHSRSAIEMPPTSSPKTPPCQATSYRFFSFSLKYSFCVFSFPRADFFCFIVSCVFPLSSTSPKKTPPSNDVGGEIDRALTTAR